MNESTEERPAQIRTLSPPGVRPALEDHFGKLVKRLAGGDVVMLLGAGVNLCGRPVDVTWQRGHYLPSGRELARFLSEEIDCSARYRRGSDLARVSTHVALDLGDLPLYKKLRSIFDHDYPPTPLHEFLGRLPARLRAAGRPPLELVITTNYDAVLEKAFENAGEPYELVYYVCQGEHRGKFVHRSPSGSETLIDKPNEYTGLLRGREADTIILKIHGAVHRGLATERPGAARKDSYVITEDDYLDYLGRMSVEQFIPISVLEKMRDSHFLFLGYSLQDWNLRVLLQRLWEGELSCRSWAVQLEPDTFERRFWDRKNVEILDVDLEQYVAGLDAALDRR